MSGHQSNPSTDNLMTRVSPGVLQIPCGSKNMTFEDCGITQSVISRRLLNPFRLTEAEIKSSVTVKGRT